MMGVVLVAMLMLLAISLLHVSSSSSPSSNQQLTICFHTNEFNNRGTTVAIYDYAHYNEVLLKHKSIFLMPNLTAVFEGVSYPKFHKRFGTIHSYELTDSGGMVQKAVDLKCDVLYIMKSGDLLSGPAFHKQFACEGPPLSVHAIFNYHRHGSAYAMLSIAQIRAINPRIVTSLSAQQLDESWVPHIVQIPTLSAIEQEEVQKLDFRKKYKISSNATVFCRHGGDDTFNIPYAHEAVCQVANQRPQTHFLFLGTKVCHCFAINTSYLCPN